MKTHIFEITAIALMLAGIFNGCSNDNNTIDSRDIKLEKVSLFSCDKSVKSTGTDVSEYIKVSAINNKTLKVEQKFFMNCCTEDIEIECNSESGNITISIADSDGGCNCLCPRIISYMVCNLQKDKEYEFVFLRNGHEYYTCKLFFNNQLEIIINL